MNSLHHTVWQGSWDHCQTMLEEKKNIALAIYRQRIAEGADPADPYAGMDVPEYLDDPLLDSLCRLNEMEMDDAAGYVQDFLKKVRAETKDLPMEEMHNYMLEQLRCELNDHVYYGVPPYSFGLLLSMIVELEDVYTQRLYRDFPYSAEMLYQKYFKPLCDYTEAMEGSMFAVEKMLHYHQKELDCAPEDIEANLFRYAHDQLIEEGTLPVPSDNDAIMDDKHVDLCGERAQELFTDMLEPYKDALPTEWFPELAWFVTNLTDHYRTLYGIQKSYIAVSPQPHVHGKEYNLRIAQNDNDQDIYSNVMQDLGRIFLRHLNAAHDVNALLAAKKDMDTILEGPAPIQARRG